MVKVKINTKSNYRNLNGKWLEVFEAVESRITCFVLDDETGKVIKIDFNVSEISGMNYYKID